MSGSGDYLNRFESGDSFAVLQPDEILRQRDRRIFRRKLIVGMCENGNILFAKANGNCTVALLKLVNGSDMIEVGMSKKDSRRRQLHFRQLSGKKERFGAGVDDPSLGVDNEDRAVHGIGTDLEGCAIFYFHVRNYIIDRLIIWYNFSNGRNRTEMMITLHCLIIMMGATIGLLFWKMRERTQADEKRIKGNFLLGLSGLMSEISLADGKLTDDETKLANHIFAEMDLSDSERALCVGHFSLAKGEKKGAGFHARRFLASSNPSACAFLYELLWMMSRADGVVDQREDDLLKEIANYLQLDASAYDTCKAQGHLKYSRGALIAAGVPYSLLMLAHS